MSFFKSVSVPSKWAQVLMEPGSTHRRNLDKVQRASGCKVTSDSSEFTISSNQSADACKICAKYIEYSTSAIAGETVHISPGDHPSDMLVHFVPGNFFSSIYARNTAYISQLEEEMEVLCFAADGKEASVLNARASHVLNKQGTTCVFATDGTRDYKPDSVPVVILGRSARRLMALKLKFMSMIESKVGGLYTVSDKVDLTKTVYLHYETPGLCVDTIPVAEEEISLATGRQGLNRKRIAATANCALDYIGACAFVYGDLTERQSARNFLTIVLERGRGTFSAQRWRGAVGVTSIEFSSEQISIVNGKGGQAIQQIEDTLNVMCFMEGSSITRSSSFDNVRKISTQPLLPPVMRSSSVPDSIFATRSLSAGEPRVTLFILGKDENAQCAMKQFHEKLGVKPNPVGKIARIPSSPAESVARSSNSAVDSLSDDQEIKNLFTKLFRGKANKISVSSPPPAGNRLQTAIWDSMVLIMDSRKLRRLQSIYSAVSPIPNFSVVEIPSSFATASGNNIVSLMKQLDEDYGVMSGYVQHPGDSSFVVMYGALRRRRAAELKLMATIETKHKGFYSHRVVRDDLRVCDQAWFVQTVDFDTDSYPIPEKELSFALGHKGAMRKKLATASGCIIEYVGEVAYLSGTLEERTRGRDYLGWILQQLEGEVLVPEYQRRLDLSFIPLRNRQAGYVNGNKGRLLRAAEELTGCFCFVGKALHSSDSTKPLIICGLDTAKEAATAALETFLKDHQNSTWNDDGASEEANSIDGLKAELESILKAAGMSVKKPRDPWKIGSNESSTYVWLCQPCPGAARSDTDVFKDSVKSEILMTGTLSPKSPVHAPARDFKNDSIAFPELGGRKSVTSPPEIAKKMETAVTPVSVYSPPVAKSPSSSRDGAIIFIDQEKRQVWGDWGMGPNGDPEYAKTVAAAPAQTKLMGAWK